MLNELVTLIYMIVTTTVGLSIWGFMYDARLKEAEAWGWRGVAIVLSCYLALAVCFSGFVWVVLVFPM